MDMIKAIAVSALCVGIIFSSTPGAFADETSELILKLLIKKGLVTQKDVDELKAEVSEIKKEEALEADKVGKDVKKASWTEKIKLKGDIRLRNDYQRPGSGTFINRQRIRARAGIEAEIIDTVKGGIALATGGAGNARSTNQTLGAAFGTKAIDLDKAYIEWTPNDKMNFTGGKYANPLYRPGDLLWDSDLTFEGASTNMKYTLKDLGIPADLMVNGGIFLLDDLANDIKNPFLYTGQVGLGSSIGDIADWKGYLGYLDFAHLRGTASGNLAPAAGRADPAGYYYYDYNIMEASGDVTLHFMEKTFSKPFNKPLKIFGDYAINTADGHKRNAWQLGAALGGKPKKFGDWRAVYNFRRFERNAFPDQFPDADSFRGRADGFGHETIFSYGLAKNIWLEFDFYGFRDKTRGVDPNEKWGYIFQSDLNIKF
ncbi:putative porin [Candidatus Omnitrophota bacterium]